MLLKLDALMIILFAGLLVPVFYILFEGDNKPLMIVSTTIMMISFLFEILAYKSVIIQIIKIIYIYIFFCFFLKNLLMLIFFFLIA